MNTLLSEIDLRSRHGGGMTNSPFVNGLIWLFGLGLICYILWWFIGYLALPAPFDKVARAIVGFAAVVGLIVIILSVTGSPW